ncbi:hypothetical protein U0F29_29130, partial [Bacillus thuringiensis]|nr:hypothetical protein [Bacillus thuringiensis]
DINFYFNTFTDSTKELYILVMYNMYNSLFFIDFYNLGLDNERKLLFHFLQLPNKVASLFTPFTIHS